MTYEEALNLLSRYGQTQLLDYYGELSPEEKEVLLASIEKLDFSVLDCLKEDGAKAVGKLTPCDLLTVEQIRENRARYEKIGVEAIKSGKVAAVLLAGGQGTRLGLNAPKGCFNIGVDKKLSIFGCQMENVKSAAKAAGGKFLLFIMTSALNDSATRAFFKENDYFGYDPDYIKFYVQDSTPVCSEDGKFLLDEKFRPTLSPNGNGGWYVSLLNSEHGALLKERGIEWLNVYGVDNVLQRMCDPAFVGATVEGGYNCAGKVVRKTDPQEKVGVLCKEDGKPTVVEYYEFPEELVNLRDSEGGLVFSSGVILNYLFSVKKLDEVCGEKLPYHVAKKKVAYIEGGEKVVPGEPNALKFELLALDLVKLMGDCLAYEVVRQQEFAPVKNATGADSVQTARALLQLNGVEI